MNDDDEEAMVVMQESHPPQVEERESPETKPGAEHGEQFGALEAAGAAPSDAEKADERDEHGEAGDSSSIGESRVEVIVGVEVPADKDAVFLREEVDGEDTASLVAPAEKEDELIGRVEDLAAKEIERGESSMAVQEDEKFDGHGEAQTAVKQDGESNVVEEIAKVRESEEVDGSELNGGGSLAVGLEDCEMMEEGNKEAPDTGCKIAKESETELNEGTDKMEVEDEEEIKMDERQPEAVEEKDTMTEKVDGGEEGHEVLPVTVDVKEDQLVAGAEDMIAIQKDVGGDEKLDVDRETCIDQNKHDDAIETAEVDEKMAGEREVEDVGCSENKHDESIEAIEIANVYDKMAGEREIEEGDCFKNKHDDLINAIESANVDEKMVGEREIEEVDCSLMNSDGSLTSQGNEMVEGGMTKSLEAEIKLVKDSKLELKEDAKEVGVEEEKEFKIVERQEEAEVEVHEASPIGETATEEEENQFDAVTESAEVAEAPKVKELCPYGGEEKLDGDKEEQMDSKQDDEPSVGGETAKLDEKMGRNREMEEVDGSQQNADGLSPVTLLDDDMAEDGKTKTVGIELNEGKESGIDLKEELGEMEVNERQREAEEEDKEMDSGVEKEAKDEDREDEKEVDGSQQNADGLSPVTSLDDDMAEDGKTKTVGTVLNAGKESEIDIKDESGEMEVDERQREEKEEDKDMDSGEEKEGKDEDIEDEKEVTPKSGSGKQKRGRNSKIAGRAAPRKTAGEDVCFICLDGGDLVLCDRRSCPKAYHPSCVDHDEAFFRSKGRWDCGWHLCRQCKKNAHYMCYTCQFSLCKGCLTDDAKFFCVRGSKGLCHSCMKTVMLIENNEGNVDMAAFDDTSSMDYLFKDYWTEQKERLSITSDEIVMLINRWKGSNADGDSEMLAETHADGSIGKSEASSAKKRGKRRLKSQSEGADPSLDNSSKDDLGNVPRRKKAKKLSRSCAFGDPTNQCTSSQNSTEWASKELINFVAHVKNGDVSALSPFDVQELILEYVKSNKLRDPRRTSQIVCDAKLQKLFGKPRVGHIEMLKLLESHFFSKDDSHGDDHEGSVLDAEISQHGTDENTDSFIDAGKSKGRKARKRGDRGLQSNLDDYAAVDIHNIKLIYLRRKLIEALLEDRERFYEKVVGSFVRIRIAGSSQKEIHRLVQVIGTPEATVPYKVGKRTAYCMLEILNLNKTEVISIDAISNQEFDEDECKRLRQSIKCGFLSRLTVGDVLDKARDLQVVRVNDWLETEITRLNHLRDRASDLGRKKQLRECVEKLQLLNTPEERQRRLDEIPEVHADPNMDPSHESEDESESDKGQEPDIWRRETWRERDNFSSRRGGDSPSTNPWSSASKSPSKKWETSRSLSGKGFSSRPGDAVFAEEALSGKPWSPVGDKTPYQSTSSEKLRTPPEMLTGNQGQVSETRLNRSPSETSRTSSASSVVQNEIKPSETEKLWHYKDPTGKVQGPFSVVQLRKWNKNGYFPATLRIWKTNQSENESILLSEALAGRFQIEPPVQAVAKPVETTPPQQVHRGPVVISRLQVDQNRGIDQMSPTMPRSQSLFSSNNDSQSRTPTSSQSITPGSTGRTRVSRWSGSPTPPAQLPSPTPDNRSQLSRSSSIYDQSTREAVNLSRSTGRDDHERLGSVYPVQNPPSHHTQQSVMTETTATVSTNTGIVQNPAVGQNPNGWGSSGQAVLNPNLFTTNAMHTQNTNATHTQGQQQQQQQQQQQPVYSHWQGTPANNLPPPPPTYNNTAGQTMSAATFPTQAHLSAMPSQAAPWTMSQLPTAQPATTQLPGNAAGWGQQMQQQQQQQAYINMGWGVAPSGPSPAGAQQYGSQQPGGTVAGQASGMQPGSANPSGWAAPPAANPAAAGPWNWQPRQAQGQGMVAPAGAWIPKGQKPCPYLMQGYCKKGAACDFRHN